MVRSCAAALAATVAVPAFGQITLHASINVDDQFWAFVGPNPAAQGVFFLSGSNWSTTFSGDYVFPGPGTYYLQVMARNTGGPGMFIGDFSLENPNGSTFSNGTASLLTNTTNWVASPNGFAANAPAPLDEGVNNGTAVWGSLPSHNAAAHFVWSQPADNTVGYRYFTTVVTIVPAPSAAIGLGLMSVATVRRRSR